MDSALRRSRTHPWPAFSPTINPPVMSKVDTSSTNQPTKEDAIPGLGVLEEDDEFEEFPVQGEHTPFRTSELCLTRSSSQHLLVVALQYSRLGRFTDGSR